MARASRLGKGRSCGLSRRLNRLDGRLWDRTGPPGRGASYL